MLLAGFSIIKIITVLIYLIYKQLGRCSKNIRKVFEKLKSLNL